MAQLMKQWLRGQIETELRDAISWQHNLANASISQPSIKAEPGRYRYDGTRLHINLRLSDPNRPFVQFVEFVKREPPYPCRIADGEYVILARFSTQCEEDFKASTKRDLSRIACGAFLQLRRAELCIDPTSAKHPIFLLIEEITGISIASPQGAVGRRNDLDSINTLAPLLKTLVEQIKQNPGWRFHDQTQASQRVHPSVSQILAAEKVATVPHGTSLSSQPQQAILMSQAPEDVSKPRPNRRPEPIQAAVVDVDSDSVSSVRSARITTKRRRGGGQMYDRRVFHESVVDGRIFPETNRVASRGHGHRTLITEEDDESDVEVIASSKKEKERYDSSIGSDVHSPKVRTPRVKPEPDRQPIRDQASPSDQLVIADEHHSRNDRVLVGSKPDGAESQGKVLDEHAVTSPYSQSRSQVLKNQPREGARSEINPDYGVESPEGDLAIAPHEKTWHGVARMLRSVTIVPTDQREVLQSKASQYPATAGGRFPPGNVPIEVLQSVRRAWEPREQLNELQLQEKIDVNRDGEGGSGACLVSPARSANSPLSEQATSPATSLSWSPSPAPERRASLPPDSSAVSPAQAILQQVQANTRHNAAIPSQRVPTGATGHGQARGASTSSGSNSDDNDMEMETLVPRAFVTESVVASPSQDRPPPTHATPRSVPRTDRHDSQRRAYMKAPPSVVQEDVTTMHSSRNKQPTDLFAELEEHLNSQTESSNVNTPQRSNTTLDQQASAARDTAVLRSSGESSVTRIPCTYPSAKVPATQPSRLVKSFDQPLVRPQEEQPPLSSPIKLPKKQTRVLDDLGQSPEQLPPGWERRTNRQGVGFYIDHHTKSTTLHRPTARQSEAKRAIDIAQQSHHRGSGRQDPLLDSQKIGAPLRSIPRDLPAPGATSISHISPRHPRSQLPATLDSSTYNTQGSSTVSHDPALDVVKQKSTFLDGVYDDCGLYGLFTKAYPGFRATERKFNSIIEYQVWPVREELAPKCLDDFVFQYEKLYEPYLLERVGMQGSQLMPYLAFYQREAGSLLLPNKIITSRRLEDFMDAQLHSKSAASIESNTRKVGHQMAIATGAQHGSTTQKSDQAAVRSSLQHPKATDSIQGKRPAQAGSDNNERAKRRKVSEPGGETGGPHPDTQDDHRFEHWYPSRRQKPHENRNILQQYADAYCKLLSNNTKDDAASTSQLRWEY